MNQESPGQGRRAGWRAPLRSWAPGLVMLREGPEERSALTLFTALAPAWPRCPLPCVGCRVWVSPEGRGEPSWLAAYGEKMSRGILAPDLSGSDSFMAPPRVSPQRWPFNFLASFNA